MTVTLLCTEIEGSTRLVTQLGAAYAPTLDRHRLAVRTALASTGGEEIDCRGDEFSAAFGGAADAVAATQAIQGGPVDPARSAGFRWPRGETR